jgi:hypothetical protein
MVLLSRTLSWARFVFCSSFLKLMYYATIKWFAIEEKNYRVEFFITCLSIWSRRKKLSSLQNLWLSRKWILYIISSHFYHESLKVNFIWMQVIQLQGDQRKNVSTFLVQVCIMLLIIMCLKFYCEMVLYSLNISVLFVTGGHRKKGEYQDSWFLRLIKSVQNLATC